MGSSLRLWLAGLTLAAMNVPQALGYTKIAGMPVVTGLYTLLLPLVAFAAFGSSRYLVVAADSATAAILAGALSHMAPVASEQNVALAAFVASGVLRKTQTADGDVYYWLVKDPDEKKARSK